MRKLRWMSILLLVTMLTSLVPFNYAQAVEPSSLKSKFDSVDATGNNGNWLKTANNDSGGLVWNESYVMNAYMIMYEVTKDTKYLDKLVDHATSVLKTRDSARGVTDYRGLSLPAWRTLKYTVNSQPYIFAGHTGMLTYPMADFARVVYKNQALWPKYKNHADVLLKAAKDAVAVHDDEWRQSGDTGWYIERKGAPEKWDGANIPFNLMLAIARTQLAIWQATGEQVYYDRVKLIAQTYKYNLVSDSTGAYMWYYTFGKGFSGWTAAEGISVNSPNFSGYKNFEDVSHGSIDVDFAVLAHEAGIVFTETDMKKFGLTVEKKMLRSDGKVSYTVQGVTESPSAAHIARWLRLNKWAPSLFDYSYKLSLSGASGLLSIAKLNQANLEKLGLWRPTPATGGGTTQPTDPDSGSGTTPDSGTGTNPDSGTGTTPDPGTGTTSQVEMITNGSFDQNRTGWGGTQGSVGAETNGNKYAVNGYTWHFYQDFNLTKGTDYKLTAKTRKGAATSEARFSFAFFDAAGNSLPFYHYRYIHKGTGWETLPETAIPVPAEAVKVRLYLLASSGTGTHDFDDISFKATVQTDNSTPVDSEPVNPDPVNPEPETPIDTTAPTVNITSPAPGIFGGTQSIRAVASDDTGADQVYFEYAPEGQDSWTKLGDGIQEGHNWGYQWDTSALADGKYNLRAAALDQAGNTGYSTVIKVTIDNTKPVVGTIETNYLLRGTASLQVSASDNETLTKVIFEYSPNQDDQWQVLGQAAQGDGRWTINWDTTLLADGVYYLRAVAYDTAGNITSSEKVMTAIDNTRPVISQVSLSPGELVADGIATATLLYQLSEGADARVYILNSGGMPVKTLFLGYQDAGLKMLSWDGKDDNGLVVPGIYTLRVEATDLARNQAVPANASITVIEPDTIAPQVDIKEPLDNSILAGTIAVKATATDNIKVSKVTFEYAVEGQTSWAKLGDAVQAGNDWNFLWVTTAQGDGNYIVRAVAVDPSGNTGYSTVHKVVIDNTKPVLSPLELTPDKFVADGSAKTTLKYQLSETADVKAVVLNSAGTAVKTLFQGRQAAGTKTMTWDGRGDSGVLAPGSYALRIETVDLAGNLGTTASAAITLLAPETSEAVVNGSFIDGRTGWSSGGTIKTESNGNKYVETNYGFQLYQDLRLVPGKQYKLNALTRKGTAAAGTRIYIAHVDAAGKVLSSFTVKYNHKGTGWEGIPETIVNVPAGTALTRLHLLVDSGSGTHSFDNISLKVYEPVIKNGSFNDGITGWSSNGTIKTESNGNKYVEAKYGFHLYQDLKLEAGKQYQFKALTRKGTAATARIYIAHVDAAGKIISDITIRYNHIGTAWESIPTETITVPAGTVTTGIFLLANSGTGTVDFDNLTMNQI